MRAGRDDSKRRRRLGAARIRSGFHTDWDPTIPSAGPLVACGAEPGKMIAMVLREAMILTAIGLAIGLPLAIGVGKTLRAFLFGVQPMDPVTLAASCIVLTMVALLSAYVPARRASRIDPIAALREG
jgi:putative ABC transport system permease protein